MGIVSEKMMFERDARQAGLPARQEQLFDTPEERPEIIYNEGDVLLVGSLACAGFTWKDRQGEIFNPRVDDNSRLDHDVEVVFHSSNPIEAETVGFDDSEVDDIQSQTGDFNITLEELVIKAYTRLGTQNNEGNLNG